MPLTGQAKTDYQREYMKRKRSNAVLDPPVRPTVLDPLGPVRPATVNTKPVPNQEKLAKLRHLIANPDALQSARSPVKEEANTILPMYNPRCSRGNKRIHKPGDRVRMAGPTGKIIEVIVPELDEEGNPVPDM